MIDTETYNKNTEWFKIAYNNLVEKAKTRGLNKRKLGYYTEKHHIVPKCMGGKNERSNYVLFTFREHLVAHELLARIYDDIVDLKHVLYFMYHGSSKEHKIEIRMTSRQLEELRIASIEFLSKKFKGREIKREWTEKASKTKKERYNKGLSDYSRKMMALGRVGMVFTEERKKKISESMKGKTISEETREKQRIARGIKIQGPDGTMYESVKECSKKLNISTIKVNLLLKDPNSGYKILSIGAKTLKVIDPDGDVHSSLKKCAEKYGRDPKCIKNWVENYPEKGFKYYTEENDNTDKQ